MKNYVSLFALLIISAIAYSQTEVPSKKELKQLKKQKKEADMLLETVNEYFNFYRNDPDFSVRTCPEKWRNESAVIICKQTDYTHGQIASKDVSVRKDERIRILLNDKNAVNYFSFFYLPLNLNEVYMNEYAYFKILKKDGSVQVVTPEDALEVEKQNIPEPYANELENVFSKQWYKVAIPNLEVGDILDYIIADVNSPKMVLTFLENVYPCMKQKANHFVTTEKLFLIAFSENGAPELERYTNNNSKVAAYRFIDSNRDAANTEPFVIKHLEEPCIKVKAIKGNKKDAMYKDYFEAGGKQSPKKNISNAEMLQTVNEIIEMNLTHRDIIDNCITVINAYPNKNISEEFKVELIFNALRQQKNMYFLGQVLNSSSQILIYKYFTDNWESINFVPAMLELMRKYNIPAEVVVIPNRLFAKKSTMCFSHEIQYAIKYKEKIIFAPGHFNTMQTATASTQTSDAYLLKYNSKTNKAEDAIDYKLPLSNAKDNIIQSDKYVTLDSNMQNMRVRDTIAFGGYYKISPHTLFLRKLDLEGEDDYLLGVTSLKSKKSLELDFMDERNTNGSENQNKTAAEINIARNNVANKVSAADKIKERKADFLNYLKTVNQKIILLDTSYIISSGRKSDSDMFKQINVWEIGDLVNKAGENYVIGLTELIENDVNISEQNRIRQHAFNKSVPYVNKNTIGFFIPRGYTVQGLENLNVSIKNVLGSYTASAQIVNNVLYISSTKIFEVCNAGKNDWDKILEIYDAAYNFSQTKLVLKKI